MAKVIIYLPDHESAALNQLAQREYRAPKAQAALIIRRELERLGLVEALSTNERKTNQKPEDNPRKAL
jgi:hypothetical protein